MRGALLFYSQTLNDKENKEQIEPLIYTKNTPSIKTLNIFMSENQCSLVAKKHSFNFANHSVRFKRSQLIKLILTNYKIK